MAHRAEENWIMDYKNIVERVVWTFVEAFIGTVLAVEWVFGGTDTNVSTVLAAGAVAGLAATLAVIKNVAAEKLRP